MNNDLISREALLESIGQHPEMEGNHRAAQVLDCILAAPVVDAVPVVHGSPIYHNRPEIYTSYEATQKTTEDGEPLYKKSCRILQNNRMGYCPACKKRLCSRFVNHCPHCGAKMDKEATNAD